MEDIIKKHAEIAAEKLSNFYSEEFTARIQKALLLLESVERLEAWMETYPENEVILFLDTASKKEKFICCSRYSDLDGCWSPTLADAINNALASTLGGK